MSAPAQRPLFALFLRLGGVAALASMLMLGKVATESGVALLEVLFWRQAASLPLIAGYLAATGGLHRLRTHRIKSHARRGLAGMVGMLCTFGGVSLLPLAEATTLGFTSPLFAVMLSATIMGEPVGRWRWLAVALGFAGVVVIAQPGGAPFNALGTATALGGAFMVAIISFQLRDLGRTEESIRTTFYFSVFGTGMAALALPFTMSPHTGTQWAVLLGIGVLGTIGQLLITAALRWGSVASVIVMDYSSLIWATLFGWLIWDRLPSASTWLGAPLIAGAGVLIAVREQRLAREKPMGPLAA